MDILFKEENIPRKQFWWQAESLSNLGDTSCTKHTKPKTWEGVWNKGSFGYTIKYGTLLFKDEEGILLIR